VGEATVEALRSQRQGAVQEVNTAIRVVVAIGPNVEHDVPLDRLGVSAVRNVPTLRDAGVVRVEIEGELVALERAVEEKFHHQSATIGAARTHHARRGGPARECDRDSIQNPVEPCFNVGDRARVVRSNAAVASLRSNGRARRRTREAIPARCGVATDSGTYRCRINHDTATHSSADCTVTAHPLGDSSTRTRSARDVAARAAIRFRAARAHVPLGTPAAPREQDAQHRTLYPRHHPERMPRT
jgi:hypothetical protein